MKTASSVWRVLAGSGLILLGTTLAQASGITQLFTAPAGNDLVVWDSLPTFTSQVPSGSTVLTANHDTVTVSFNCPSADCSPGPGSSGTVYLQGSTWLGAINEFSADSYILSTEDTFGNPDSLTLTFTSADVSQFGVYIQDFDYSLPFTASITTTSIDGNLTFTQTSTNGSYMFLGVQDSNGPNISAVTIDISGGANHYLGISDAVLTEGTPPPPPPPPPTPEPASLLLMASGLAALAWKARRRSRVS